MFSSRSTTAFSFSLVMVIVLVLTGASTPGTLIGEEPSSIGRFGGSVAIGDGVLFISEPTDFRNPGMVHIYLKDDSGSWTHLQHVVSPEARVGDRFGQHVAAAGNLLLVADYSSTDGSVQVYGPDEESGDYIHRQTLRGATGDQGQGFGSAISSVGNQIWVGAPGANKSAGLVYVYRVSDTGTVLPVSIIEGESSGVRFGSAIAAFGDGVAVGSPGFGNGVGMIDVYAWDGTAVAKTLTVAKDSTDGRTGFGGVIAASGTEIFAGLPRAAGIVGAVEVISVGDGEMPTFQRIAAPDSTDRGMFGSSILAVGDELWIGAPRANGQRGVLHRMTRSDGTWISGGSLANDQVMPGDAFGSAITFGSGTAVVSASGDDYGLGSTYLYEQDGGDWTLSAYLFREFETVNVPAGEQFDCEDGVAGEFDCNEVDLVSFVPNADMEMNRGVRLNDVWGWTDPETGKEYALIGHMEAMAILDVSNAASPIYLGTLPMTEGARGNTWRDIKTYKDHAIIAADRSGNHGMQVFDLRQLRGITDYPVTFEATALYDNVKSVHNIVINEETGYAYAVGSNSGGETCGGGLHMIDINDPKNPTFAGCFTDTTTGRNNSGATHDAQCVTYSGPDTEHRGKEICISSNGTAISIADVSDKDNPLAISTGSYPGYAYVHQGWLTEDQRYFYQNDEADELVGLVEKTRTMIWDLSDLDDPIMIREHFGPTSATDHNLYVKGNYMYQTNNASGLRVFDVSDAENPVEVGHFDTTPYGEDVAGFNGTWSSYPFFESGNIIVTSRREGVFIVRKKQRGT